MVCVMSRKQPAPTTSRWSLYAFLHDDCGENRLRGWRRVRLLQLYTAAEGLALTRHDSNSSCMRRVLWNEAHPEAALEQGEEARMAPRGCKQLYTYSIAQ